MKRSIGLALATASVALAGCATNTVRPVEVTRFHLGAPLERGTLIIQPAPGGDASSLEFRTYAAAVEREALRNGFGTPAAGGTAQYLGVVGFTRTVREGPPRSSGVSIGLGGGSYGGGYGGGVGVGGGVSFPIGKRRYRELVTTDLSVQIRRRADATVIWEGHAVNTADGAAIDAQPDAAAAKLAGALFRGFPGESGRTITVR